MTDELAQIGDDNSLLVLDDMAHELVHVWLGRGGLFNLVNMMPAQHEAEQYCNRVAAEFLVPGYKLTARWEDARATTNPFQTIAGWFKVSPIVAARRALDLRLITKPTFFKFYEQDRADWQQIKRAVKKKTGGNFYATHELYGRFIKQRDLTDVFNVNIGGFNLQKIGNDIT